MLIFEPKKYEPIFPIIGFEEIEKVYNYFTGEVLYVYRVGHNNLDIYSDHQLSKYICSCPCNGIVAPLYNQEQVWSICNLMATPVLSEKIYYQLLKI
jgi:hypothetical protein